MGLGDKASQVRDGRKAAQQEVSRLQEDPWVGLSVAGCIFQTPDRSETPVVGCF